MKLNTSNRLPKQSNLTSVFIFALFLTTGLAASFHLNAQNLSWTASYPSLSAANIGILGDPISVNLRFTITTSAPAEASAAKSIQLVLPTGVTVASVADGGGVSGSISPGTYSQTGTAVTIPITSMSYNQEVHLAVTLEANSCSTPVSGSIQVSVLSGGTVINTTQTPTLSVVKAILRSTHTNPQSTAVAINTDVPFSITLDVTNGVGVKSMKLTLAKDKFTTLSEIKLGSTTLTPISTTATSVVLTLTEAIVGTTSISAAHPQTLSFKASASTGGEHSIRANVVVPETGAACISLNDLFHVKLTNETTQTGTGSIKFDHFPSFTATTNYLAVNPKTNAPMPLSFKTPDANYLQTTPVLNTGMVDITRLRIQIKETYGGSYRRDSYINRSLPIYYAITSTTSYTSSDIKELDAQNANCVYVDLLAKTTSFRILKDEFVSEYSGVEFTVTDPIPPDYYLHVFIPKTTGQTFDNSDWGTIRAIYQSAGYNLTGNLTFFCIDEDSWDVNGNKLTVTKNGDTYWGRFNHPAFVTALSSLSVKAGEQTAATIPFRKFAVKSNHAYYFYVRLPEWLTLTGSPQLNGTNIFTSQTLLSSGDTYYTAGYNTYKLKFLASGEYVGNIMMTYTAKADGSSAGQYDYAGAPTVTENIRYWIDWDTGDGITDNPDPTQETRPVITYVAKNNQNLTCIVSSAGVRMDNFKLNRVTRGLAVKGAANGQNRTPGNDAGSGKAALASSSVIDHSVYLPDDEGQAIINAEILNTGYGYMGVLLTSDYIPNFNLIASSATVHISGTDYPASEIKISGNKAYVSFPCPSGTFAQANATITIPFKAKSIVASTLKALEAEVYMSVGVPADPFNPTAREGLDKMVENWCTYRPYGILQGAPEANSITSAGSTELDLGYICNQYPWENNIAYSSPGEYRPYVHPLSVTVTLPEGLIPSWLRLGSLSSSLRDITSVVKTSQYITNTGGNPEITNLGDGRIQYKYKLDGIFNFNSDSYEEVRADSIAGKWIAPDDVFQYQVLIGASPLPTLASTGQIQVTSAFAVQPNFNTANPATSTIYSNFTNTSPHGDLVISDNIAVFDPRVTVTSVRAGIVNGSFPAWLYIDGNVSDIQIRDKAATPTTPSVSGRWISLGTLTSPPIDYELKYKLTDLTNHSVKVYLIADFDGSLGTPTGTIADFIADPVNAKYMGSPKTITHILSTNSVLQGSIAVPNYQVAYNTLYDVDLSVNSLSGEANVDNPVITLATPVGQVLEKTTGALQYEYPIGTWQNIPAGAINDATSGQVVINTSQFSPGNTFTLFGNKAPATDNDRKLNLRLKFKADCNTNLSGFYYSVSLSGKGLNNVNAAGVSNLNSGMIKTNADNNYLFDADVALTGERAFGGKDSINTLQVTLSKKSGQWDQITEKDSLIVLLPRWLKLNGNITTINTTLSINNQTVPAGNISVTEITGNKRRIAIKLPKSALDAATDNGTGIPFTYNLPIVYTEDRANADLRNNPEQPIQANVYTFVHFGTCSSSAPFSIGEDSETVALLTIESSNRFTYNMTCEHCDITFNVTSADFAGGWYANATMSSLLIAGNEYQHTSTAAGVLPVYVKANFGDPTRSYGKVSIDIKALPTKLYWRSAMADHPDADNNWYNPVNWEVTPGSGYNPNGYLPAPCSEIVLQPSITDCFPELTDSAACHIIHFTDHTEIGRQDLLVYDSARVDLMLGANQWYMLSAPLQGFYSGDIHHSNPNPFYDGPTGLGLMIDPMLFNTSNPETGKRTTTYKWSGRFNTADYEFRAGQGFAIWVDDWSTTQYTEHSDITFSFPKSYTQYFYHHPAPPHAAMYGSLALDRTNSHRLHEVSTTGDITLTTSQADGEKFILVGNPFMAHLDFEEFANYNSGIEKEYKLAYGVSSQNGKMNTLATYKESGGSWYTTDTDPNPATDKHLIPPMQSFIVVSTSGSTPVLKANISHTVTSAYPTNRRRAASASESPENFKDLKVFDEKLEILATRAGQVCKALLLLRDGATHDYVPEEDGYKLFSESSRKPVQVYMRSRDGHALDINTVGNLTEQIPLGIRTSEEGNITLQFTGMDSFRDGTDIRLHDTRAGKVINLSQQPSYTFTFTKEGADTLYLENRLYLTLSGITSIDDPAQDNSGISITHYRRDIHVLSHDGAALGRITICDVQGRILSDETVTTSEYHHPMDVPGVYIVRVYDGRMTATRKVTIK